MWDKTIMADCNTTTINQTTTRQFNASAISNAGSALGDGIIFNYTADARLGV
jgi:phage gp45-like